MIFGKLEAFFATGTEGIVWSVHENGKEGYDGLNMLDPGDYLMIFHPVTGIILWEGNIDFEYKRNRVPYPNNPQYDQQAVLGYWVNGLQVNVPPEDWGRWFLKEYPAVLIQSHYGKFHIVDSSTIESYSYNGLHSYVKDRPGKSGDFIIKFKNGAYYRYADVPPEVHIKWMNAVSKGKFFASDIKDKFVTEKLNVPKYDHKKDGLIPWPFPSASPVKQEQSWTEEEEQAFKDLEKKD